MPTDPATLDPVPTLLRRLRAELAADFLPDRPVRVSRAPGRLDVMGGIADYTGSLVCEMPLDRAAAVALQSRDDRQVQVCSLNLLDEHRPFTLRVPLDALARHGADALRRGFDEPGRTWAAYLVGCLFVLHERGLVDLAGPRHAGMNLALFSTVTPGAGVGSSAAVEVATMVNLVDHFGLRGRVAALDVAAMCQAAENRVVGAPCGVMDQAASCLGEAGALMRMVCQPHELLPPLRLPPGVRVVGIDSGVRHRVGGGQYGRTRCAAFMGHRLILERMREMGAAAGRELTGDPTGGYLANLDPDDYKRFFRPSLPELLRGRAFLDRHGPTADAATRVEPDVEYAVQRAVDHHVLEARRVRRFVEFLEQAGARAGGAASDVSSPERAVAAASSPNAPAVPRARPPGAPLDRAGHLMYASHLSYTNDAMLGAPECDLLVDLVRKRERAGLYGAKITGGGSGGTVAVLCDAGEGPDAAIAELVAEYERQTGKKPEVFTGTSAGAWDLGTRIVY
jgi:galactokinase